MSRSATSAAALAALLLAAPALAKDVCVALDSAGSQVVFKKVKALKKPGTAIALNGLYVVEGNSAPVSGTAVVRSNGTVGFGFFVHGMEPIFAANAEFVLEGSDAIIASGQIDTDGDHTANLAVEMTPIDCGTVVVP